MLIDVKLVKIIKYNDTLDIPDNEIEALKNGDGAYFFEDDDFMRDCEMFGYEDWDYELVDHETGETITPFLSRR